MNLTLAVDCGTTNLKAGLVNSEGKLVAHTTRPIELQHPEPDAAEHSPQDIYDAFRSAVREVASERRDEIAMMGLSGYQFGFMPMDSDYRPLTGMITLLDGRSRREVTQMTDLLPQEELYRISGLPPMFTSLLAKILWMKREKQELFGKTAFFADIKSFLLHRLTGRFVTEPSIAATTQMLDLSTMDWAPRLVRAAGISTDQLPKVVSGNETAGTLSSAAAEQLNLPPDLPVLPGLYDGGAMMVGMGGLTGREGVCSIGTSTMLRICVDEPVLDHPDARRLQTYPLFPGTWATGGGINNGGVVLQWCRDELMPDATYEQILEAAADIPAGAEGVLCLPYLSGERDPRIGENASGVFLGIRQKHGSAHMVRAALEGVACTVNLIKEAAEANGIEIEDIRICGSGSQSDLWCQIFADISGCPVRRPIQEDATLTGTAILASVELGIFDNIVEATGAMLQNGDIFQPDSRRTETYDRQFHIHEEMLRPARTLFSLQTELSDR